jgi:hypothetical protein
MQLFLIGYIIIEICEIFTVGWFPLNGAVRRVFSAVQIAAIVADLWILMMNGAVGYQLIDDGTFLSLGLVFGSAAALFVGTGYIALDTGFSWTGFFDPTLQDPNRSYSLYTLYQLVPLVFLVVYFLLETILVLRVLGEVRPMSKLHPKLHNSANTNSSISVPGSRSHHVRHRPNIPIRDQRVHLQRLQWQTQRRLLRNSLHTLCGHPNLGLLVEHNRRRLANTRDNKQHLHMIQHVRDSGRKTRQSGNFGAITTTAVYRSST